MPQRVCSQNAQRWIWGRTHCQGRHGFDGSLGHWQKDRSGLQHQHHQVRGLDKLLQSLGQMLDGWHKTDGPVLKNLPVEADIPRHLVNLGLQPSALQFDKAVGDLALICILLSVIIGE